MCIKLKIKIPEKRQMIKLWCLYIYMFKAYSIQHSMHRFIDFIYNTEQVFT